MAKKPIRGTNEVEESKQLDALVSDVSEIIDSARRRGVRAVNTMMTAAYWSIGRRIVDEEQRGRQRAEYGDAVIESLSTRLSSTYGRGFAPRNLAQMRAFFLAYPEILQTVSAKSHDSSNST